MTKARLNVKGPLGPQDYSLSSYNAIGRLWLKIGKLCLKLFCRIFHNGLFAQSKIRNLDVSLLVKHKHDVVHLEVLVYDAVAVEVGDTDGYLCCIKSERDNSMAEICICSTYVATGSLNLPTCCIWNMRSPPATYSRTK